MPCSHCGTREAHMHGSYGYCGGGGGVTQRNPEVLYNPPNTYTADNTWGLWSNQIQNSTTTWGNWVQTNQGYPLQTVISSAYSTSQLTFVTWVDQTEEVAKGRRAKRVLRDRQRAEQHAAEIQQRERERREIERLSQIQEARDRAMVLFKSLLTPEQIQTLEEHQYVDVRSSHGRRFRIRCDHGYSGNVELYNHAGTRRIGRYCAHARDGHYHGILPQPDHWATQLLALEADEDIFMGVANAHEGPAPRNVTEELLAAA